jgi:hypothetical protein
MGLERDMVDGARTATGDEILVAGLFTFLNGPTGLGSTPGNPRAHTAGPLAGAHARGNGDDGGDGRAGRVRGRGHLLRGLVRSGAVAATTAAATPDGHPRLVVAVSPTRVYLLRQAPGPGDRLCLAHTFDRRRVDVSIHARQESRTLTLEDTWTRERFELEGERSPEAQVTATMHALSGIHDLAS